LWENSFSCDGYYEQFLVQNEVAPNNKVKNKPPGDEVQAADLH
jgi:hypothetical protein